MNAIMIKICQNSFKITDLAWNVSRVIITYSVCDILWLNQTLFSLYKKKVLATFDYMREQKNAWK